MQNRDGSYFVRMESRMALGCVKGKYWVADDRYSSYVNRESYKALLRAATKAGFFVEVSFSYTAQRYTAEISTVSPLGRDGNLYIIKHNNAYDPNPMAALTRAIRESGRATLLVQACCLEIESELLIDAYREARRREAAMAKLEAAVDGLAVCVQKLFGSLLIAEIASWTDEPYSAFVDEDDDL